MRLKLLIWCSGIEFNQVKKEVRNAKRTVLKSVVGTLDLNIRYLLHGETFPGVQLCFVYI